MTDLCTPNLNTSVPTESATRIIGLSIAAAFLALSLAAEVSADDSDSKRFSMSAIGHVQKTRDSTKIVLQEKYTSGLLGLDGFSHAFVFWWFDRNDSPEQRAILQVHPMGDETNPLTGVFATRSPVRPNLLALTLCRIVSVKENVLEVERIDAFDGTPVLDIKPFIPGYDSVSEAKLPEWLERKRRRETGVGKTEQ